MFSFACKEFVFFVCFYSLNKIMSNDVGFVSSCGKRKKKER